MRYRWIMVTAVALSALPATPALAVDSATCAAGGEPHAGRQFTLSARTEPISGNFTYAFDMDNDGSYEKATGTESSVVTEQARAGTYTYRVLVTDNDLPDGDPKREARGTCDVTVVNDPPFPYFEVHPVEESFPTAYEAIRFTFSGSDNENDLNQVPMTHAIDFDGDGQFEFTELGNGEVYASFPAGFDRDVTHRITDSAGASVDTRIHIKPPRNLFGIGGTTVLAPLSRGALPKVTASAPKTVKRKTLIKKGFVAKFNWGATWGRVTARPAIGKESTSFTYEGDAGYAPGQQLTINRLPPSFVKKIRKGAKKIVLRWSAKGQEGAEQTGTLTVKIKK